RERVASLEASLASASGDRDRLERDCGEHRERLEDALRAGVEHAAQLERDRARAEAAEQALIAVRTELDGARVLLETAARERATDADREIARLERERGEVATLLDQERGSARGLAAAVALARAEVEEERARTGLAGADAARLAGKLSDLEDRLAEREREVDLRSGEADAAERALLALRDEAARLEEQLQEARESRRAEQVRGRSLLDEVERLAGVEAELEGARERLAEATALAGVESELEQARAALQQRVEAAGAAERELADRARRLQELERDLGAAQVDIGRLGEELARARTDTKATQELVELRLTAVRQVEETSRLQEEARQRDPLLESLTTQLEERERRAALLERKINQLEERCKEHESDVAAWDTELKFRSSRIAQLEEEQRELSRKAAGAPGSPGQMPPPAGESPIVLKKQIIDLNAELGDRDADLLLIHARAEEIKLKLDRTRKALQNLLSAGQVGSATAVQIHDIIISMERLGG
ncbi:MAG TPA: hypothetical protein VM285_03055, partial [Polyangia bacterium]|nr:hypothetical protein [Polyangia bacterium]